MAGRVRGSGTGAARPRGGSSRPCWEWGREPGAGSGHACGREDRSRVHGLIVAWYAWLSHLAQGPISRIQGWEEHINLPLMSAVLFGLIGATSPCQLTTKSTALINGRLMCS